jgi:hypothetical protein
LKSAELAIAGSKAEIQKRVKELKPKYSDREIEAAYDKLARIEAQPIEQGGIH